MFHPRYELSESPQDTWLWDRSKLEQWQLVQLNRQLAYILPANRFYREKFGSDCLQLGSLDEIHQLPLTTKRELVDAIGPAGWSPHQTYPPEEYSRLHRTSGTTGQPMMILDTVEDWHGWWSTTWQHVLEAAGVTTKDRVFLAFSFGPFVGFWSAHQACADRGCMVITGGGLSSLARLEFLRQTQATVLFCTPTYAMHLAEVAAEEKIDLQSFAVDRIIVAGEAGGSVKAVRDRIASLWHAQVIDHCGATEVGPWGLGWPDRPGVHVIETSFVAELLPIDNASQVCDPNGIRIARIALEGQGDNALYELVLTSLGRYGAPVFRYRTGDIVRASLPQSGKCRFLWLDGGVLGRTDDMLIIRGVNIFPSSIDAVLREFHEVGEYRVLVSRRQHLDQLNLEVEVDESTLATVRKRLEIALGIRVEVQAVPKGTLPRHEGKSRRWIDQRF